MVLSKGLPELAKAAKENGVAVLAINNSHHMAAMWPETEKLAEIREIIEHDKVSCVFSEPQFNPDIINAVAKDMNISTGVLDPLGATLNPGKDLYFDLITNMSKSFKGC